MTLRVLVVDDTIVFRKAISDALASIPNIEVVGTAANGKAALMRIIELSPDLVTLDIEMPEMNGIEVLQAIKDKNIDVGVIVLSALTKKGGQLTLKALELGAFDFFTKPSEGSMDKCRETLRMELAFRLNAFARRRDVQSILKGKKSDPTVPTPLKQSSELHVQRTSSYTTQCKRPEMVVIGVSTGGPNALAEMLPHIPADLGVPVLIVQHMPPLFTQSLAENLSVKCKLRIKEAADNETIIPNTAYIAPGGKQMKIVKGQNADKIIRITDDPPENHCKPSVDYLFRSVALTFPGLATGVIMTGMGNDGTLGLKLMKRQGAFVIAQDEASCVVYGMPKEAMNAGVVDICVPLSHIAGEIIKSVKK